jgi:hypothetical protein
VEAMVLFKQAKIEVVTFPSHGAHILQSFDVSLGRSVEAELRKILNVAA